MHKVSFTISERIEALKILNDFKGNLELLNVVLKDVDKFTVLDEEWEGAERKCVIDGKVITKSELDEMMDKAREEKDEKMLSKTYQLTWSDEKGGEKEIELSDKTVTYLLEKVKERNDKGDLGFRDKSLISVKEKLDA